MRAATMPPLLPSTPFMSETAIPVHASASISLSCSRQTEN